MITNKEKKFIVALLKYYEIESEEMGQIQRAVGGNLESLNDVLNENELDELIIKLN